MYLVSQKKLDKAYEVLLTAGYKYDPNNFTIEHLIAVAKDDTGRANLVESFFNGGGKEQMVEFVFKQISTLIHKAQTTPGVEYDEYHILNKISEHAIVALREHDYNWLMRIRQVLVNGMKQFKIQMAKRNENVIGTTF